MTPATEATIVDPVHTTPGARAWRVEVFRDPAHDDPEGNQCLAAIRELGIQSVEGVRLGRGYLLDPALTEARVREIAADLLADPVLDRPRFTAPGEAPARAAASAILVAPKPGVMDPVAQTVQRALVRTGRLTEDAAPVQTFRAWELEGSPTAEEVRHIGQRVCANETIETLLIGAEALPYATVPTKSDRGPVEVTLLSLDDEALLELSRTGELSLTLEEMRCIQAHFAALGREPLACELETIAQTWSEHCKHKTLTGIIEFEGERIDNLLRSTIGRATRELDRDWCVSVFKDNAGIVRFDEENDVCFKVETHNHPSAIDPYGGAGTGIGGVIRDILGAGLGAKPIANTNAFFVGPPDLPQDRLPKGCMHPRRILRGVVAGVRDYGNRMGIPTVNGGVWFDEGYVANPLVYAGTVGLIPRGMAEKEVKPGDFIVSVGGRTGRDGIHGATFSSVELHEDSETASSSAVQIGDPITEKRVLDGLLKARDQGLYRGLTDCGAGGFSSAVGEMAEECGADVDLSSVPLKYPGLSSHEIWVSEAQERMVLAVPPEHLDACLAVFRSEDSEATVIGTFTDTGRLVVRDVGEVVCDLDMHFLHKGTPRPVRTAAWSAPRAEDPGCPPCADVGATITALLSAPNIASKSWIIRQYDHEVQGTSAIKPLVGEGGDGPGDAAVMTPVAGSSLGLAISCGTNPAYGVLDPEGMALAAIDEALRNAVAVGADPTRAAILDNFSWGNCDKPDRLGSLVLAARACYDAAIAYGAPFISGKDSLNNEYRVGGESRSIPPTLLISCIAPVPDVRRATTMDLKRAGNRLYLVGATAAELGGSHYLEHLGSAGGRVPRPDLQRAPKVLTALHAAIRDGHVRSVHDLSEGGLAVAAAEMAFAGNLGARIDLARIELTEPGAGVDPDAAKLFSESCTRFVVEVEPDASAAFEAALTGLPCAAIGEVTADPELLIQGTSGSTLTRIPIDDLRRAHSGGFNG